MVAKYGQFKMLKWLLTETVLQYLKLVMQLNGETLPRAHGVITTTTQQKENI